MEEASTSGGQGTLCGRGRRRRGETASGGRCAPRAPSSYAYILLLLLPSPPPPSGPTGGSSRRNPSSPPRRSSPSPLRRQGLRADPPYASPSPPPAAPCIHPPRPRASISYSCGALRPSAPPSSPPAARPRLLLRLALVSSCGVLRFELGRQDRNLINVRGPLRPRAVTVLTPGSCDASARPTWCSLPINVAPPPSSSRTPVWLGRRHLQGRHTCAQRLIISQSRDHKGEREVYDAWEQYLGMEHTDTAPKWSIQ